MAVGKKGLPAGDKTRGDLTHAAQSKALLVYVSPMRFFFLRSLYHYVLLRVPVSVGRVLRAASRWPDPDARPCPAFD
jgi:hypothetical protein